jgi:hypothetical protein
MACRIAISFAAVAMSISCIATDASATCKFKAKKDIVVFLDVGHTDKDSGQISARGSSARLTIIPASRSKAGIRDSASALVCNPQSNCRQSGRWGGGAILRRACATNLMRSFR